MSDELKQLKTDLKKIDTKIKRVINYPHSDNQKIVHKRAMEIASLVMNKCGIMISMKRCLARMSASRFHEGCVMVGDHGQEEMITKNGQSFAVDSGYVNISQSIKANENTTKILEALKK